MDEKWFLGILSGLILLIAGALLLDPGGLLNPKEPELKIASFESYGLSVGTRPTASITVLNEGDTAATDCIVGWSPSHSGSLEEEVRTLGMRTTRFGLKADDKVTFSAIPAQASYSKPGTVTQVAVIDCNEADAMVERDVTIFQAP